MNFSKKHLYLIASITFLVSAVPLVILWKKVNYLSKKEQSIARRQNAEVLTLKGVASSLNQVITTYKNGAASLSQKLSKIKCAQQLGIVKRVKTLDLSSAVLSPDFSPYNPSIIEKEGGGYHIFFRHDESKDIWQTFPFYSYIGYADLDENFSPQKIIDKVNTGSRFSEDPRIVKVGEDLFLSWNDKIDSEIYCRTIHSGKWNPKSYKLEYVTNLDQHIKLVEKNWVPFERWEKNTPSLGFVYGIQPHKILDIPHPEKNEAIHLCSLGDAALRKLEWSNQWGSLCGGTPARLINGEYISFFHSCFKEESGIIWYVMGAYTFEAEAPYKIKAITPYPILFPGIYESKLTNTSDPMKKVIYPAGIAIEKDGNKHLLHVSCGENDCAIKIVTIDYEKIRTNMVPL